MANLNFEFLNIESEEAVNVKKKRSKQPTLEVQQAVTVQQIVQFAKSVQTWKKGLLLFLIPNVLMFLFTMNTVPSLSSQIQNKVGQNTYLLAIEDYIFTALQSYLIALGMKLEAIFLYSDNYVELLYGDGLITLISLLILYSVIGKWLIKPSEQLAKNIAVVFISSGLMTIGMLLMAIFARQQFYSQGYEIIFQFDLVQVLWRSFVIAFICSVIAQISVRQDITTYIQVVKLAFINVTRLVIVTLFIEIIFTDLIEETVIGELVDFGYDTSGAGIGIIAALFGAVVHFNEVNLAAAMQSTLSALFSVKPFQWIDGSYTFMWLAILYLYVRFLKRSAMKLNYLLKEQFKKTSAIYALTVVIALTFVFSFAQTGVFIYTYESLSTAIFSRITWNIWTFLFIYLGIIVLFKRFRLYQL